MTSKSPALTLCELADPGLPGIESHSPFCLKTHRALRFAGLSYERRFGRAPADFKHWNPTGQVPVLLVDGEPVSDSTRILHRIDALTGAFTRSLGARQRAEAWLWEDFADTALNGFLVSARWAHDENWPLVRETYFGAAPWFVKQLIVPKLRKKVIATLVARDVWRGGREACWERFQTTLDDLDERAPDSGFWVDEVISVADVSLFGQLHSLRTPLTKGHAAELGKRARLSAYLDRVDAATQESRAQNERSQPVVELSLAWHGVGSTGEHPALRAKRTAQRIA
jgi:glutathione S-transferase